MQTQRQLPYIQINEPPLKLLIDTGANQSFISPDAVQTYFNEFELDYDPFEVTNVHATSRNNYSVTLPCFPEFNDPGDIKFFIYKFHNHFDGLIGLDLLTKWEAKIDLKDQTLTTLSAVNPIKMFNSRNVNLYEDIVPAHSSKVIRLPINTLDGEVLVPEQVICNCVIHECLTTVVNNRGLLEVSNPTSNDIIFSLDCPAQAELFTAECTRTEQLSKRTRDVISRLRTDHLNAEERANILALCSSYADVFYLESEPLTFTNRIKHKIKTSDELPVYTKSYRYPFVHRQEVTDQINKMLEQGIIRPSESAWSSPIWVVPKKSDASGKQKWRLVVDFRKLNEKTINDKYPIPNISDVLDKLGKCQYFTTLDLASGFYQVEMDPEDIPKTAFNVEHGHFEFLRMPMGLKNSPSTFQRVMDNVLRGLQNEICLVYLDDIIIFSTSLQEHIINLGKVFQRLRESNFKIQLDKSEFLKRETAYLGHIIGEEGVRPNPDKISAIKKYPIPKTPKEIKQFLGLIGYYRKFIPDFARITKPLTLCLKKGKKITMDADYVNSFQACKTLLTNDPILKYPDFDKEFVLTTDASNFAIGAVLSQGPIGSDKPVSYASRTLNDSEINYSTIEKELLAIVWACKYFRPYLFGRKFKIITDHQPLQWLMNLKEPNSRLTRWRLKLSEYDYTITYKKGKSNTNADALSRIEIHNEELDSIVVNISSSSSEHSESTVTAPDSRPLISSSSTDTAPSRRPLSSPTPNCDPNDDLQNDSQPRVDVGTVHTAVENPLLEIPITEDPLNKYQRQLCLTVVRSIKRRPVVTKPFDTHLRISVQISESQLEEDIINTMKEYVKPNVKTALLITPPEALYSIVPILQRNFKNSSMDLVITKTEIDNVQEYLRQQDIIKHYHDGKTNHRGVSECYLALSHRYYWPKMKTHITKFINECTICGQAKYDRNPIRQEFSVVPPATKPLEIIHLDLFTVENEKYLTFIDVFTKYGQAYHLRDGTAISVIQAVLKFCSHHGFPLMIITDNGTEFTNQLFSEFVRLHEISHHKTLAHAPNGNGNIERFHSTLLEHLRILKLKQKEPIVNLMPYAIIGYNNSIHSFTKCRPHDLLTGHFDPRSPLDFSPNELLLQQYIQSHRELMKTVYDKVNETSLGNRTQLIEQRNRTREPEVEYQPQQQVFIKNPLASRQKVAPRYTKDSVLKNLPIHIYTSRKRGPVAKTRLKRPHRSPNLLQDNTDADELPGTSSRNKT